jgi:hypothetical protein
VSVLGCRSTPTRVRRPARRWCVVSSRLRFPRRAALLHGIASECEGLRSNPNWQFESFAFISLPNSAGDCPTATAGLSPVQRRAGGIPTIASLRTWACATSSSSVAAHCRGMVRGRLLCARLASRARLQRSVNGACRMTAGLSALPLCVRRLRRTATQGRSTTASPLGQETGDRRWPAEFAGANDDRPGDRQRQA